MKKIITVTILIIIITTITIFQNSKTEKKEEPLKENYLSSNTNKVELYDENFEKVKELPRGTKVQKTEKQKQKKRK